MTVKKFEAGDRVSTPAGPGEILYWRFGSPDFTEVVAYSVRLDKRKGEYNYAGTIFPSKEVQEEV